MKNKQAHVYRCIKWQPTKANKTETIANRNPLKYVVLPTCTLLPWYKGRDHQMSCLNLNAPDAVTLLPVLVNNAQASDHLWKAWRCRWLVVGSQPWQPSHQSIPAMTTSVQTQYQSTCSFVTLDKQNAYNHSNDHFQVNLGYLPSSEKVWSIFYTLAALSDTHLPVSRHWTNHNS